MWVVHRRGGKDKTAWNATIKKAVEKVGVYFYFLPTYTQAKKVIWDGIDKDGSRFLDHIPKEITRKVNETEMKIELINGSIIQLIGADNIDRVVGTNPIGCVFSEYSLMKPDVWEYIRPILAENGGWAIFIYTPRGMNHGWKLLQQAKSDPSWFAQVLTVGDTNAISLDALEAERREMPEALFKQEYYCEFVEGAGAFFRGIDRNLWSGNLDPQYGHLYQLGADLAKYQDWTVLTPVDLHTFKVGTQERFQQVDWNLQKARIESACRRYNLAKVWIDSTGLGDPILDDLLARGLPVEGFKFTEQSRKQLLDNLAVLLEQDRIKIPNDPILIDELRSFQYTMGESGKLKVAVPEGLHDDAVMSLALAVWKLSHPLGNTADISEWLDSGYSKQSYR